MGKILAWYKVQKLWVKVALALPVGVLVILGLFAFRPNGSADVAIGAILKDDAGSVADK